MKIHQLLAVITASKNGFARKKAELDSVVQKAQLFKGLSRIYSPRVDGEFVYPSEAMPTQLTSARVLELYRNSLKDFLDLAATQDISNQSASADVEIEGNIILSSVPVSHLLFLEKTLGEIRAFVSRVPVLDSDKEWEFDGNRGCYKTPARETVKTKKISKAVVLYDATPEHPAQVKESSEDIVEGIWTTIEFSGGLPQSVLNEILDRCDSLLKAVVSAREEANSAEVTQVKTCDPIFNFILDPLRK
jgi:hypothetical protein